MYAIRSYYALIAVASAVSAQPPMMGGRGPMPMSALDTNGDGTISQQEFDSFHAQRGYGPRGTMDPPRFADFDRNGDGSVSADELAQGQQLRRQQMWGGGTTGTPPVGLV